VYAIAYKETSRSSWIMMTKTYEDRETVDAVIIKLKRGFGYAKLQRVFFEEDI
jgi:hypothetical protein